jgi:hypothetical protein
MIRKIKRLLILLITLSIVLGVCFYKYVNDYYESNVSIKDVNIQDNIKIEETDDYILFNVNNAKGGFIFYPGAKVESEAYIPLMQELAKNKIMCILIKMPFHLAIFDINAADRVKEKYGQIKKWYVGGHSLGGAMASTYISKRASQYSGLILLAAYSTKNISNRNINVISIYGSEDKVLSQRKYNKYKTNLPSDYKEYIIEGGIHSYFANYGLQKGDGTPTITREKQIQLTAQFISENF